MKETSKAMVQTGRRTIVPAEFPIPAIGPDEAILRVEASGICGSDYEAYQGMSAIRTPFIPGHEPLGLIEEIGERASARWGVQAGDRVAVEPTISCGWCRDCLGGSYRRCTSSGTGRAVYGARSTEIEPRLWGAFAEYMYLAPQTIVHKISPRLSAEKAVLFNPLGAGIRWSVHLPKTTIGDTVVILGAGQRGLCSVVACREAGAANIIVTGLNADLPKLEIARALGADHIINVSVEAAVPRVLELTAGRGADVIVDVTSGAPGVLNEALEMAAPGGRIVLAGFKRGEGIPSFQSDRIIHKELTIIGALVVDFRAFEPAIRLLESNRYPFDLLSTHSFPLDRAEEGIQALAGENGERAVHVTIRP